MPRNIKSSKMKKTSLLICVQIAMFGSIHASAKSTRTTGAAQYNQLMINDQSMRAHQNEIATQLNDLQQYTKDQNQNYNQAIDGLIQENDKLIDLNQSMLTEIEKLSKQMLVLKNSSDANKENLLSLTQATTKKVKEIQTFIDNEKQQNQNLTGNSKMLLIGLGLLSLLLSGLLWSMIRKQNKKTLRLKTEVERVLNQIQTNTDSAMANWTEQQNDTMNIWKKNFQTEINEVIKQSIKNSTQTHIEEIKQAANATIAAENATAERILLEENQATNNAEDNGLNLSQLSRTEPVTDSHINEADLDKLQAINSSNPKIAVDKLATETLSSLSAEDAYPSDDTLHQLDTVMSYSNNADITPPSEMESISPINSKNDIKEEVLAQSNIVENSDSVSTEAVDSGIQAIEDSIPSEDILASLDAQTAELAKDADVTGLSSVDGLSLSDIEDDLDDDEMEMVDLDELDNDAVEFALEEEVALEEAIVNEAISNEAITTELAPTETIEPIENIIEEFSEPDSLVNSISLQELPNSQEDFEETVTETITDVNSNEQKVVEASEEPVVEIEIDDLINNTEDTVVSDEIQLEELEDNIETEQEASADDSWNKDVVNVFNRLIDEDQSTREPVVEQSFIQEKRPKTQINSEYFDKLQSEVAGIKSTSVETPVITEVSNTSEISSEVNNIEEPQEETQVDPSTEFNQAQAYESSGNAPIAIEQYTSFIRDHEFDSNDDTVKLVGLALDKKAKLLLSNNRVNEAIDAYDRIISKYDNAKEQYAKDMVAEALLKSSLLELVNKGSINGTKVGTARTVFRHEPHNMLAVETLETLRLSARRDVSHTQKELLQRYDDVDLINLDWQSIENWANGLNASAQPRVMDTIAFFKNWNEQPSMYS